MSGWPHNTKTIIIHNILAHIHTRMHTAYTITTYTYISLFIAGRLSPIDNCPRRISFSTSQVLLTQLHIQQTSNTVPSLKQLQTQLNSLSKAGRIDDALKIVQTVKQLDYPLHSNIICQLLNFATKWENKDVFSAALDIVNDDKVHYDEQLYTIVIKGLLAFYGFKDALGVYDEMVSEGLVPRRNLLYHLFEDCLKRNDTEYSCFFFDSLLARSILPPVELIIEFITLCLNEALHDYIMKLLEYYSSLNVPLEEKLVHHLKYYFEAYSKRYMVT